MIRKANLSELSIIAKLYYKHMSKQFRDVGERPISVQQYLKRVKSNFRKSSMYVLDEGGIKGFLWFYKDGDEYALEEIFVTENGKGYGKHLMDFVLQKAKAQKIKKLNGDVHFKNKHAQNFFKSFGFTERTIEMSLDL